MSNKEMFDDVNDQELVEIKHESTDLVTRAQDMRIFCAETYTVGAEFLKAIKTAQKKVAEFCDPVIKKAHATWKEACNQKNKLAEPLEKSESLIKDKMRIYNDEQTRLANLARAKAEQEAREQAEKLNAKAEKLEAKGKTEQADELRQQAVSQPVPVITQATPKVAGISFKENWEYDITDEALVPREYLALDFTKIRKAVNVFKKSDAIPGVRAYRKDIVAGKGA